MSCLDVKDVSFFEGLTFASYFNTNLTPDPEYSSFSLYLSHALYLLHASLSHLVKDKTRWPGTWSSSPLLSRCKADFLTDREMIWTVQLHFSTRVDNIYVGLRLEKPLIETSQVVTLQTEVLCGIRRADRGRDHFQPRLKIKKKKLQRGT